jgi:hypothetical protein
MLLAALFAYWTWPSRLARTLPRSLISGYFSIFRIELCGLLVSLLCPGLGAFYLAYPTLMKSEVLAMSMGILVEAVQTWAFMGMFLAMPIIGCSVVVGCLIGLGVHTASKHLVNSTPGAETEVRNTQVNFASPSTLWRTSKAGPWTSLVAGLIVAAIMLAGFNLMGFWIFTFWIQNFMKVAIPCIALGAAIGSISKHWALCVAASLPIGFYLSNTHYNSPGIFTSQSIDFPPVLFAVLMGFGLARKFAPRIFARLQG